MDLELSLDLDDAPRLTRLSMLARLRQGKARGRPARILWHDSPDRTLADAGLVLAEQRPFWRLERLWQDGADGPPGAPAAVLASSRDRRELGHKLPDALVPSVAFAGRETRLELATEQGPVGLTLVVGAVRTVAEERPVCRLRLTGPTEAVRQLSLMLARELELTVPRASLAAEAAAIATGGTPGPRREGAPRLPGGLAIDAAFAHVVGHLAGVILQYAPEAAAGQDGPEPVHQMRVAVRRLRSAIKVFLPAVGCPAVEAADAGLKTLAARLGPARDWDVLVTETLAAAADAFPAEPRLRRLLAAAERRRQACHDALRSYLQGGEFRRLGITLACLAVAPERPEDLDAVETPPLEDFAASVLARRLKKLTQDDEDLEAMEPAALHAIRLRAKRLRYAAEILAPLYGGKPAHRFIRRLSRLQERLGALNDGAVAAGLLGELSGGNHAFAVGLVLGFIGAHSGGRRQKIEQAWQKFHSLPPFWT